MSLPPAPRYGTADVSLLVPTLTDAVRGQGADLLGLHTPVRHAVLLVIDGLGSQQLDDHAELAPTLVAARRRVVDAPYPSTTATSLTSIGTGLAPGEHGLVSYSLAMPDDDRPLITLTWSWQRQDLDLDARDEVPPEQLQPRPTAFERAGVEGVRAETVLRPEFITSGLTRYGLRSGRAHPAVGLSESLEVALGAVAADEDPSIVYVHHGDLDALGHLTAAGSPQWRDELQRIDRALDETRRRLPPDTALVVTADHGMIRVPEGRFVELADDPAWLDGVRVLTGDPRARQLHTHRGASDTVLRTWRERCGEDAVALSRDEAIGAGWFGPVVYPEICERIGDVVVAATGDAAWVHREQDLFGGRLPGQHGGLTRAELEVPVIVFEETT